MANQSKGKKITIDVGITNDMQLAFFVRGDATELEGKQVLEMLIAKLETEELKFSAFSGIEKHRDDTRTQLVHDMTHEKNHNHD